MTLTINNEWPDTLPLPLIEYSGTPRHATINSPEDTPSIDRRSRFTRSYNTLEVSWCFTHEQFELFQSFVRYDLGNGTAQFKIELKFPKNSALTEWAVRFEGSYEAEEVDGLWKVNAALELVNPVVF